MQVKSLEQISSNFQQMGNFVRLGANGIATNSHLKQIGGYTVIDLIVSEPGVVTLSVG